MSKYIATRAIRGANALVAEAAALLEKAIAEKGAETPVAFPNTAYFLPVANGMLGLEVSTLGQLREVMAHARKMLHPLPRDQVWSPYLGETLDCGQATLLAAETIEAGNPVSRAAAVIVVATWLVIAGVIVALMIRALGR